MRVVFVLTYPSYHSVRDQNEWLRLINRDRRLPGLLAALGVDVELWGVGAEPVDIVSVTHGSAPYRLRLFPADPGGGPTRDHVSRALVEAAASPDIALFVLIGTNGGIGFDLFRRVLRPGRRRFAVIVGGDPWSRIVPHAALLFTESDRQEQVLRRPGWRLWRRAIPPSRMVRLAKSIDTNRFRPMPEVARRHDVVAVSRLTRWKSFEEVGALSATHNVAVAGDGPRRAELARRFPGIAWLGHVPGDEVPALLAAARVFVHAGRREWFPRAIPEAMACGVPVVAFDDRFGPDVVPPACGLLVNERSYRDDVAALLADPGRRAAMGAAGRAHVLDTHGPDSSKPAARHLLALARA